MNGFLLAFAAALLFAAAAPASKKLLEFFHPLQLAALLYLGAAMAMVPAVVGERRRFGRVALDRVNRRRLAGVVILGGIIAPVLLLVAFQLAAASAVSLLLNLEIVATALLGVALFHEHLSGRAWIGVFGVVVASALLSGEAGRPGMIAALLTLLACTCWAIDNHLSALIDGMTPARSTFWKGSVAGVVNFVIAVTWERLRLPSMLALTAAIAVGAISYGASIALHTAAAQRVGAVRAQAVFASAPFLAAILSFVFLGEVVTPLQMLAAALLLISVVALVASRHEHSHRHAALRHIHAHTHDDGHHLHEHDEPVPGTHTHWHEHRPAEHTHPHWPDLHHRHSHR